MRIYVGNMSYGVKEDDLRQIFSEFGQVESVNIIMDKVSGRSKGFGFVELSSKEAGQAAIAGLNGKDLKGRTITVDEARPQANREDRRGAGGGGRGGGRMRGSGGGGHGGRGGHGNMGNSGPGRDGDGGPGGGRGGGFGAGRGKGRQGGDR